MKTDHEMLMKEYYKHLRHTESIRHQFTSAFLILIGVVLSFIPDNMENHPLILLISMIMMCLSIIGYRISQKGGIMVRRYSNCILFILEDNEIRNEMIPGYGRDETRPSISTAYNYLYGLSTVLWLGLLIFSFCQSSS